MTNIPKEYLDLTNDFGFTATSEEEVAEPIITDVKSTTEEELKKRLLEVEKLVMPLLVNLMKDSDTKVYIKWPNRKAAIEPFVEKLLKITRT